MLHYIYGRACNLEGVPKSCVMLGASETSPFVKHGTWILLTHHTKTGLWTFETPSQYDDHVCSHGISK